MKYYLTSLGRLLRSNDADVLESMTLAGWVETKDKPKLTEIHLDDFDLGGDDCLDQVVKFRNQFAEGFELVNPSPQDLLDVWVKEIRLEVLDKLLHHLEFEACDDTLKQKIEAKIEEYTGFINDVEAKETTGYNRIRSGVFRERILALQLVLKMMEE